MPILQNIAFSLGKINKIKGSSLKKSTKNHGKNDENSMQILNGKKKATKCFKKWIWEGLGLHLGGVWDGLGRLLGTSRRLGAVFWVF